MPSLYEATSSPHLVGVFGLEVVRQTLPNACGCACVATVLRQLGMYASERMIVDSMSPNRVIGITPEQILRQFNAKELMTSAFSGYPASALVDRARSGRMTMIRKTDRGDHWVIPMAVEPIKGLIIVADPSGVETSFTCQTIEAFTAEWEAISEVAILIDRPGDQSRSPKGTRRRTHFRVESYRGGMAQGVKRPYRRLGTSPGP